MAIGNVHQEAQNNAAILETQKPKRLCIKCSTELVVGVNITHKRLNKSDYTCQNCYQERGRYHSDVYKTGSKWAEYKVAYKNQVIEPFSEQWNETKGVQEISDRVYKVWNDNNRRRPEFGLPQDWICEVIFSDLWNIDPDRVVNEYMDTLPNKQGKIFARQEVLKFVLANIELLELGYKQQARNKWMTVVDSFNYKYAGKEKLVATPRHIDPFTKETYANWYLLSHTEEQEIRKQKKLSMIESTKRNIMYEQELVDNKKKVQVVEQTNAQVVNK